MQPLAPLGAAEPGGQELVGLQRGAAPTHAPLGAQETACKDPMGPAEAQGAGMQLGGGGAATGAAAAPAPPARQDALAQDVQQPPAPGALCSDGAPGALTGGITHHQ